MNGSAVTRLWITPRAGDESQLLLAWNPSRDCFELPRLANLNQDRIQLAADIERCWGQEFGLCLTVAERPVARLPAADHVDAELIGTVHAAWLNTATVVNPCREHGFEWVSARDMAMGFTTGGRSVDSMLRDILEETGRSPRTSLVNDRYLTVGVTGHRDLMPDDVPVLFDKLHQAMEDLAAEFPGRQLRVVSPLAEGADQLMADVALERNVPLMVPLPLPLDLYETDFTTPAALDEFRTTLERANRWYCLPLAAKTRLDDLQVRKHLRDEHYARVGRHVVDRSNVLLAMWDGRATKATGGTAEILRYALQAPRRPEQRLLIRHVPTRRMQHRGAY